MVLSMLENKYNISIWQGSTFGLTISIQNPNGTPKNIAGQSARMQIWQTYDSTSIIETLSTASSKRCFTGWNINI